MPLSPALSPRSDLPECDKPKKTEKPKKKKLRQAPSAETPEKQAAGATKEVAADADAHKDVKPLDVLIVGAGISGMQCLRECLKANLNVQALEKDSTPGGKWTGRGLYSCVRIQQHKNDFFLPECPWPEDTDTCATRDQTISLCETYLKKFGLEPYICCRSEVTSAKYDQDAKLWVTKSQDGRTWTSRFLAWAVGTLGGPKEPLAMVPKSVRDALSEFQGEVVQVAHYFRPLPFEGKRVIVLGYGASGVEVAQDLAWNGKCETVTIVARPKTVNDGGVLSPGADWCLSRTLPGNGSRFCSDGKRESLDTRNENVLTDMKKRHPEYPECMPKELRPTCKLTGAPLLNGDGRPLGGRVIVSEGFLDGVAQGKINVVPGTFAGSEAGAVRVKCDNKPDVWLDADVVICATGYQLPTERISKVMEPPPKNCDLLYKGMWMTDAPNVALVGHNYGFIAVLPTGYLQAKYLARVVSSQEELPSLETMRAWVSDVEQRQSVTQRFTETQYYQEIKSTWTREKDCAGTLVAQEPVGHVVKNIPSCSPKDQVTKGAVDEALAHWPTTPGSVNVLDVGCGDGNLVADLMGRLTGEEKQNVQVIGVRLAGQEALKQQCQELFSQLRHGATVQSLPVDDCSVDMVLCSCMLSEIPPCDALVGEVIRVTRPGGQIILDLKEDSAKGWMQMFDNYERPSAMKRRGLRLIHRTAQRNAPHAEVFRHYVFTVTEIPAGSVAAKRRAMEV